MTEMQRKAEIELGRHAESAQTTMKLRQVRLGGLYWPRRHRQEITLRRYLLGLASAEEQKRVEQQLLTDSDYCHELQRVEECLTDEYVRGEITGLEKRQFDRYFLQSAEHREDLEFSGLLERYFSELHVALRGSHPSVPKWRAMMEVALVSAAVVLMAASVLLFRQISNLRGESLHLQQERGAADERQRSLAGQLAEQGHRIATLKQELAEQKKLLIPPWDHAARLAGASDITFFSLSLGLDRTGTKIRRVAIPAHAQALLLELKLQRTRYRHYRAQVETVEGDVIWTADSLTARPAGNTRHRAIALLLPVKLITRSEYLVNVDGTTESGASESIGTYHLNILQPQVQHIEGHE